MKDIFKISIFTLILLIISGCQTIESSPELNSLEDIFLTQEEIEELNIEISDTTDFTYTAQAYYSDYPEIEHSEGFQGSFSRRYYFYEIGKADYIEILIAIFDSNENALKHYEDQLELSGNMNEAFNIVTEEINSYSFGDVSKILKDKTEVESNNIKTSKKDEIYFVIDNYYVKINTLMMRETETDVSIDKLAEISEIIESRLSVIEN